MGFYHEDPRRKKPRRPLAPGARARPELLCFPLCMATMRRFSSDGAEGDASYIRLPLVQAADWIGLICMTSCVAVLGYKLLSFKPPTTGVRSERNVLYYFGYNEKGMISLYVNLIAAFACTLSAHWPATACGTFFLCGTCVVTSAARARLADSPDRLCQDGITHFRRSRQGIDVMWDTSLPIVRALLTTERLGLETGQHCVLPVF